MRKFYLFVILSLYFFEAYSQATINRTFHNYYDEAHQMIKVDNNFYFSSNVYSDAFQDYCILNAIDSAGNTIFRRNIMKHEYTKFHKIIRTLDGQICIIGFASGCDFLDGSQTTFILKLDKLTGATIWDNAFSNLDANYNNDYLKDVVQYADSTYYAISDSLLFHFSKDGDSLSSINTGLTGMVSLNLRADGNLVTTASSNFPQTKLVAVLDVSGTILNQYPINDFANKTVLNNSHVYTLNKVITQRDASMQVLSTSTLSQDSIGGNVISDFDLSNDTIYACGYNLADSSSFILVLDTNLNLIANKVNQTSRVKPVSITVDEEISILINSASKPSPNGIIGVYSIPKNGTYQFSEDIGVTEVIVDSGYVTYSAIWYPPTSSYLYSLGSKYFKARAVVKNYGSIPVTKLQVNSLTYPYGICGNSYFVKPIDSVNILPGQTDTLDMGWINYAISQMPSTTQPIGYYPASLCLNTSIPNWTHDVQSNNDGACANYNLPVVGLKDIKTEIEMQLFPNPTNGILTINSEAMIETIFVQDISGRTMKHLVQNRTKSCEIDLGELSTGIYFLVIKTNIGSVTRKVIKE